MPWARVHSVGFPLRILTRGLCKFPSTFCEYVLTIVDDIFILHIQLVVFPVFSCVFPVILMWSMKTCRSCTMGILGSQFPVIAFANAYAAPLFRFCLCNLTQLEVLLTQTLLIMTNSKLNTMLEGFWPGPHVVPPQVEAVLAQ